MRKIWGILSVCVFMFGVGVTQASAQDTDSCYCTSGAAVFCMGSDCTGEYQGELTMAGCSAACSSSISAPQDHVALDNVVRTKNLKAADDLLREPRKSFASFPRN